MTAQAAMLAALSILLAARPAAAEGPEVIEGLGPKRANGCSTIPGSSARPRRRHRPAAFRPILFRAKPEVPDRRRDPTELSSGLMVEEVGGGSHGKRADQDANLTRSEEALERAAARFLGRK